MQRESSAPWPHLRALPSCRSAPRVNRQLQPGWARLELFLCAPHLPGKAAEAAVGAQGRSSSWTKGAREAGACALVGGTHSGPCWTDVRKGKDRDACATGAGLLSDSSSRAAAHGWPEAPSSVPPGSVRGPGLSGKSAMPGRPLQRQSSPQSRPERRFPCSALGWGKPGLLGGASN